MCQALFIPEAVSNKGLIVRLEGGADPSPALYKKHRTALVVQGLRLRTSSAGAVSLTPGRGDEDVTRLLARQKTKPEQGA